MIESFFAYLLFSGFSLSLIFIIVLFLLKNSLLFLYVRAYAKAGASFAREWSFFMLPFGFLALLLFFVLNRGSLPKMQKALRALVGFAIAALLISIILLPSATIAAGQNGIFYTPTAPYFVQYDRAGNVFPVEGLFERRETYYTAAGDRYDYAYLEDYGDSAYVRSDEGHYILENNAFIDENGFLVDMPYESIHHKTLGGGTTIKNDIEYYEPYSVIHYDDAGNLYYSPRDCAWDKHGSMLIIDKRVRDFVEEYHHSER